MVGRPPIPVVFDTREEQQQWLMYRYVERHPRCTLREVCLGVGFSMRNAAGLARQLVLDARVVELKEKKGPARYVVVKGRSDYFSAS